MAVSNDSEFFLTCFTYRLAMCCFMGNKAIGREEQNEHIRWSMACTYLLLHADIWQDLTRGGPGRSRHIVSLRGTRRPLAVSLWHTCFLRWVPTPQLTEHCNENCAPVTWSVCRQRSQQPSLRRHNERGPTCGCASTWATAYARTPLLSYW